MLGKNFYEFKIDYKRDALENTQIILKVLALAFS